MAEAKSKPTPFASAASSASSSLLPSPHSSLTSLEYTHLVRLITASLDEDLSSVGDVSSLSTVPAASFSVARFLSKADGVLSGLVAVEVICERVDGSLEVKWEEGIKEGSKVSKGQVFGSVKGSTRALLIAERLVLNLLQRMSGIATATSQFVSEIEKVGSKTKLLDTRKTVPGLRMLDKMAVRAGGGKNHRIGLYDMIMIKDNHITASGGVKEALDRASKWKKENEDKGGKEIRVEIETRTIAEVKEALSLGGFDRIMLDNMVKVVRGRKGEVESIDTSMLKEAVDLIGNRFETEASGNVTLETVGEISKTGVAYISTGAVTHSVIALDISLKIQEVETKEKASGEGK